MMKRISIALVCAMGGVLAIANSATAAIMYSTAGSSYTQSFDTNGTNTSLPNTPLNTSLGNSPVGWTDDNAAPAANNFSIQGFYLWHPTIQAEGGFNGRQRMRIGAGTQNTGAFMSFGPSAGATTDRAFGSLASNTLAPVVGTAPPAITEVYLGMRVTNNTGATLGSFTLTYDGEQWRDGGDAAPNAQSLTVGYKLTASGAGPLLQDIGYTPVPALTFTGPVAANTGAGAAVDGNAAGRVNNISTTITGLTWLPNTDLWIRWTDLNNAGNDHGLAIDDIQFSAQLANVSPIIADYVEPTPLNASDPGSYQHQMTAVDPDVPPQTLTWSGVSLVNYTPDFGGGVGPGSMPTITAGGLFEWDTVGSSRGIYTFGVSVDDGNGGTDNGTITVSVNAVPEPASLLMFALAMAGACIVRRSR